MDLAWLLHKLLASQRLDNSTKSGYGSIEHKNQEPIVWSDTPYDDFPRSMWNMHPGANPDPKVHISTPIGEMGLNDAQMAMPRFGMRMKEDRDRQILGEPNSPGFQQRYWDDIRLGKYRRLEDLIKKNPNFNWR